MEAWLLFPVRLITVALIAFVVYSVVDRAPLQQLGGKSPVGLEVKSAAPARERSNSRGYVPVLFGVATFCVSLVLAESLAVRRFNRACRQIESLGGSIRFAPPHEMVWARFVFSTATVDLSDTSINDQSEIDFAAIPLLKTLRLANTQVAGETIERLSRCSKLQGLDLTNTAICDEDLQHVCAIANLRSLILNGTAITNAAMPDLQACCLLKELQCDNTGITERVVLTSPSIQA